VTAAVVLSREKKPRTQVSVVNMARGSKRRWSDLSEKQRAGVVAAGVVQVALLLAALTDLRHRPDEQINGSKGMWTAVSFVNFLGPLAYFAFGRKRLSGPHPPRGGR
jgi:hypothetical protein